MTIKLISHRGNLTGPDPDRENTQEQIELALSLGFDVEVDVWYLDGQLYLGHDSPGQTIDREFLSQPGLWCHAKNLWALDYMLENDIHCFWHQEDQRTLTNHGWIWTFPDQATTGLSVLVVLDNQWPTNTTLYGVCGDYVSDWKKSYSNLF
jgi:glycerophosphoryl diester phosphodiesterase